MAKSMAVVNNGVVSNMTDIMIYDVVPRAGVIDLGKQVEGLVTRVVLPNIRRGAGAVQLVHQRSDDQKPYPVSVTEDGDKVYWIVTRSDTAFPGRGQAELQWLGENGAVAKSVTYQTNTTRSMTEPGAVPDEPLKPYTQAVAKDAQAAKNAAASATEAARSAEASAGQAGLSADNAVEAARNAEAIVGQAGQSAQSAQAAAIAAAQNAAAAETAETGAKQAQTGAEEAKTEAQAAKAAAEKAAQEAKAAQTGAVEAKTGAETAQAKAEEAAQGVAADREQIRANAAGLEAAQQDVTALKAENTALKASTARTARSLDYLWKKSKGIIYDTETVTGAGSSVTVPSGAMDYAALRMVGGMSRRGRNLLKIDIRSVTINGVAFAVDSTGRITVTGTTTTKAVFMVAIPENTFVPGETYRLTGCPTGGQGTAYKLDIADISDDTQWKEIALDIGNGSTFSGTANKCIMQIAVYASYTGNGKLIFAPMISTDTTATYNDGEPYTASLLDAPVDAVRVQGRNLLNPQIDGKAINIDTGLPATDARMCITDFIPVTPGDTYGMYSDFGNLGKLNVACYDATKTYTGKHPVDNLAGFQAFTIPVGTAYIRCCILMTGKKTSYLYRGVSAGTANDYTPYYRSTYPIPQAIRDMCPDYGQGTAESYNYIDFAAKAYYHVGSMAQDGTWTALATPEIIDLSAVWPDDDFGVLQVEAGGTINLHYPALDDGYELAVPSETEIMVDVAKVVQTNG